MRARRGGGRASSTWCEWGQRSRCSRNQGNAESGLTGRAAWARVPLQPGKMALCLHRPFGQQKGMHVYTSFTTFPGLLFSIAPELRRIMDICDLHTDTHDGNSCNSWNATTQWTWLVERVTMKSRDFVFIDPMSVLTDHWKGQSSRVWHSWKHLVVLCCILNFLGQQSTRWAIYSTCRQLLYCGVGNTTPCGRQLLFSPSLPPCSPVTHGGVAGTGLTGEILWF